MSTRERAYSIFDCLTDEQLEGFILMFGKIVDNNNKLNEETSAAIEESERMLADPATQKYDVEDALRELKK
ncbi:MAG: hypothetical protein ACI4J0_09380 [Huintestinicola sp.]|uniref:hypothetical protein n=1 Tax=Huintestinicola sp. TaxID=2981661 RepID=UPI003F0B8D4B